MTNLAHIKRRIKSAKNISQITKAMEMVSASKMKKAQEQALNARPFTEKLEEIISNISNVSKDLQHPLLEKRSSSGKTAILLISTNKGLCGGLNVNLFREVVSWAKQQNTNSDISLITVGKKAKNTIPQSNSSLIARFDEVSEDPTFEEARAIAKMIIDGYINRDFNRVFVAYPKFISTLKIDNTIKQIIPVVIKNLEKDQTQETADYIFEPGPKQLMGELLPYQIEISVYQHLIEARASEHSARMVAMKSASDNAHELIDGLTLDFNQARQSKVTNELLDATSARAALKE